MIIWTLARATVADAMRKKVLQIFLVVAIGLIVISFTFSQTLSFSSREGSSADLMLIKSFGLGLMALAGALISLVMGVQLIPQEIERRTIYTILAKPVKRYEFIIGKFVGAILTLAINIALMGAVFIITVMIKAHGSQAAVVSAASGAANQAGQAVQSIGLFDVNTLWGVLMIFLQFMVLSSVVLFFSVFFTPIVNFFMGMGVYVIGLMGSLTDTLAKADGASVFIKGFYKVVHVIIPNFDKFNVTNTLLHPEGIANLPKYVTGVALYSIIYVLIMMLAAVVIFEKKEV